MSVKAAIFVLCAQALVIRSALSQVCGRSAYAAAPGLCSYGLAGSALNSPLGYNGLVSGLSGNNLACIGLTGLAYDIYTPAVEVTPTTGGGLPVTSASAIALNNLVVASENMYEGTLAVGGELPFVGTVGLEGVLPTVGSGAVNHACGNGATRMVSLDEAAVASSFGNGFAPATAPGNIYGGIGAFGNAASASPFGYGTGLAGLVYSAASLGGGYPAASFTGAYPAASFAGTCPATSFAGAYPAVGLAGAYPATGFAGAYPNAGCGAGLGLYGGAGEGNVAVAGELPVAGTTAVAGQVPIMGAVSFGGNVPAAGVVTISGNCACGCGNSYAY